MRNQIAALLWIGVLLTACQSKQKDSWAVTQRIQYDVTIKSPDADFDWWVQNIEGMNREAFITELLNAAYQGNVKAYDVFLLNEMTADQVKNIGRRSDTLRLQRPVPPHNFRDTIINKELSIHEITRIRFLEEWNLNKENMQINKEVMGIAPLLESYDENGNLRGYQPMFWIFFDNKYPEALRGSVL
ncbi:MAG: hypothetical protein IH597_12425 [Bacteroidales bacterium]|nr:hypothetical protein [Bacteroidales bacterium]